MIPPPLAPLEWLAFFISLFPFCSSSAGVIVAGWVLLLVCSRGEVFPGSPPWLPTPEVHCWLLTCAELSWLLPSYAVLPRWCEIFALHVVPKRWWLAGSCLCLDLALIPLLRRQLLLGVSEGRNARNMKRRVLCRWTCLPLHYPSTGVNDRLLLFFSRKHPRYFCLQGNKNKQIYVLWCHLSLLGFWHFIEMPV